MKEESFLRFTDSMAGMYISKQNTKETIAYKLSSKSHISQESLMILEFSFITKPQIHTHTHTHTHRSFVQHIFLLLEVCPFSADHDTVNAKQENYTDKDYY